MRYALQHASIWLCNAVIACVAFRSYACLFVAACGQPKSLYSASRSMASIMHKRYGALTAQGLQEALQQELQTFRAAQAAAATGATATVSDSSATQPSLHELPWVYDPAGHGNSFTHRYYTMSCAADEGMFSRCTRLLLSTCYAHVPDMHDLATLLTVGRFCAACH